MGQNRVSKAWIGGLAQLERAFITQMVPHSRLFTSLDLKCDGEGAFISPGSMSIHNGRHSKNTSTQYLPSRNTSSQSPRRRAIQYISADERNLPEG